MSYINALFVLVNLGLFSLLWLLIDQGLMVLLLMLKFIFSQILLYQKCQQKTNQHHRSGNAVQPNRVATSLVHKNHIEHA